MTLNIKPIHNPLLDCIDDIVMMICSWRGLDFELAFAESWSFSFEPWNEKSSKTIGERIIGTPVDWQAFTKYFGIQIKRCENDDPCWTFEIIKDELSKGRPIVSFFDAYWYPWDLHYLKFHGTHAFIITGYNPSNHSLNLADGYYMLEAPTLPYENFEKGNQFCLTFAFEGDKTSHFDWQSVISTAIQKLQGASEATNSFHAIRRFATDIKSRLDFDIEYQGYEEQVWQAPLSENLATVIRGRRKFALTLDYLGKRYKLQEFFIGAKKLEQLASKWSAIQTKLIKAYLQKERAMLNSIVEIIKETADDEERIANELFQFSRQNISPTASAKLDNNLLKTNQNHQPVLLDLTQYLNNQGVGDSLSLSCRADLSGTGQYFYKEDLPVEPIWRIRDLSFQLPALQKWGDTKDNISCLGQKINIPAGYYQQIMLLACSEMGFFSDYITVNYENHPPEKIFINFSNCIYEPVYGEKLAWKGRMVERNGEKVEFNTRTGAHIFAYTCDLTSNERIDSILLPDCPNIHIFAISLA